MQLSNYVLQHFNLRWTLVVEGKAAYSFFANFFIFIYIIFSLPKDVSEFILLVFLQAYGFSELVYMRNDLLAASGTKTQYPTGVA